MEQLIRSRGLNGEQRAQIFALELECAACEPLCMKLNRDMLENRDPDIVNDFFYEYDGKTAGFLGLYGFGAKPKEIELTGMVRPEFRRQKIFSKLFEAAAQECRSRGAERLLLISERRSGSGTGFALHAGLTLAFSESRMCCARYTATHLTSQRVTLRHASESDLPQIVELDGLCFGRSAEPEDFLQLPEDNIFIAEFGGRMIGKIGLSAEGGQGYIFGFGVIPEYRGRGLGREMLSKTLEKYFAGGGTSVILETGIDNARAQSLYTSCGFREITVYDYYEADCRQPNGEGPRL
ncbi:MAG: GNAT family N-acetyltransferase [Clostridia bacterium]|nr:GNAT family N-acetyltransferase [Clostridia bacterium]MDR3645208.1 GNAT family N-acetyltransferase [Clostridia bacterium]